MPPERTSRPRQDPVSCQLCRTKKLKCNREQPCQNCLTRGVTCERQTRLPPNRGQHTPIVSENASILARLQRLEDLVLGSNGIESPPSASQQQRSQSVAPSQTSEREEAHRADAKWLESVGLREHSLVWVSLVPCVITLIINDSYQLSGLSGGIIFRIGPIQQKLNSTSTLDQNSDGTIVRCIWLPLQTEAILLFENYAKHVDYIYRVLHLPTVRVLLDKLYLRLAQGYEVDLGHVSLLLSIFANSAYFWTPNNCDNHLFTNVQNATQGALLWSKAALDVMDHSSRTLFGGIEDMQARIILGLLIYNFEGFSTVARSLYSSAFTIARSLYLHRTDCGNNREGSKRSRDTIETEIKRRVWWHLTSTDWSASVL